MSSLGKKKGIKLRLANPFDIPVIARMWYQMVQEAMQPSMDVDGFEVSKYALRMADFMRDNDHVILVAMDKKAIVGFIHGKTYASQYSKPRIRIFCESLYVAPSHRARSIGTDLIQRFIDLSKEKLKKAGIKPDSLEFICNYDDKTIERWRKFGYKPTEVLMRRLV